MLVIEILEIAGTAAFAISGVLVGIKNKLDWFGVFVLATITASGGGLVRDIIIGQGLPVFFTESKYFITVIISIVLGIFFCCFLNRGMIFIQLFDAAGLGVFTILATLKCIELGMPIIGIIFISTLTGIGGGMMRDILTGSVPSVLKSEIYALASIIGALCFYFLYPLIGRDINMYLCISIIFAIRMLSLHYKLNLPTIKLKNNL